MFDLSPLACRVLGSLLEKERTVPATYPLTPKGVVSACNQSTGRDPIMTITEADVGVAIRELRDAKLARTVHASHGARTEKYRQVLDETLGLDSAERAVITLLLLRGAQTPGELRSRSDRLHAFTSVDEVDAALTALANRDEPLVRQLDRRPGQKEQRWIHLLGTEADRTAQIGDDATAAPTSAPDRVPSAPSPEPAPLPPELASLAAFVGSWAGTGETRHPDLPPLPSAESLTLAPVPGRAALAYRSTTTHVDGPAVTHEECGYLRVIGDGSVELVLAHTSGAVEVCEGVIDDGELLLATTATATTSDTPEMPAVDRRFSAGDGRLTCEVSTAGTTTRVATLSRTT